MTKNPIVGLLRGENDQEYFCNIYPIFENNEVKYTLSVVTFLKDAFYIREKLDEIEKKRDILTQRLEKSNGTKWHFENIICNSELTAKAINKAKNVAKTDTNVFLQGETGTGKEIFAQAIHNYSDRKYSSFIALNCAALSKDLLEAELFGYEEGSFTNAKKGGHVGLFESANNGTLFLDEISELDRDIQAKLLRTIEEKKIRRVGSNKDIDINVRIISACNIEIEKYLKEGKFRKDLYYRLCQFPIHLPPLSMRKEDLKTFIEYYLKSASLRLKKTFSLDPKALKVLENYSYPGNIRELKNIIEFATISAPKNVITVSDLQISSEISEFDDENFNLKEKVRLFEKREILHLLEKYGNSTKSKRKVSKILGISLASLYKKLE